MSYTLSVMLILMLVQSSFKEQQLKFPRVRDAYNSKQSIVQNYFTESRIDAKGYQLFIRAFKQEEVVEVWVKEKNADTYQRLHSYPFCSSSGTLGPKRKEGDLQIPEGVYHINHFNPVSNFHLSLGINYPNASDRILSDKHKPGSAIYIHGNCVTIGCIPITDDKIKELYLLAVEARNNGQQNIPVHIFPTKMDDRNMETLLRRYSDEKLSRFWKSLQGVYQHFESHKKLATITINKEGDYVIN